MAGKRPPRAKVISVKKPEIAKTVGSIKVDSTDVVASASAMPPLVSDQDQATQSVTPRTTRFSGTPEGDVVLVQGDMPAFVGVAEDTLRLGLKEFSDAFEARRQWQLPLTGTLALLIPLLTVSKYLPMGPITADQVKACVVVGTILSGLWLAIGLVKVFMTKPVTADQIIERCRRRRNL